MIPPSRPQQSESRTREILAQHGVTAHVALLGVRGYYEDTMGKPNQNDRGIYDDAFFVVSPRVYRAYNANTDPSRYGLNPKINKGLAVLQPGVWLYRIGLHGVSRNDPYTALVQAADVVVLRDETLHVKPCREKKRESINIHKGSNKSTSSEGCQTIVPAQWLEFINLVQSELKFFQQRDIPYCLIDATNATETVTKTA